MDRADALRLVVFEYLLPMQRRRRVARLAHCFACVDAGQIASNQTVGGVFEELLRLSDRLLEGFGTSYWYPLTMQHEDGRYDRRRLVAALVDSPGPYAWSRHPHRRADPWSGFRTFREGSGMPAGVFTV